MNTHARRVLLGTISIGRPTSSVGNWPDPM